MSTATILAQDRDNLHNNVNSLLQVYWDMYAPWPFSVFDTAKLGYSAEAWQHVEALLSNGYNGRFGRAHVMFLRLPEDQEVPGIYTHVTFRLKSLESFMAPQDGRTNVLIDTRGELYPEFKEWHRTASATLLKNRAVAESLHKSIREATTWGQLVKWQPDFMVLIQSSNRSVSWTKGWKDLPQLLQRRGEIRARNMSRQLTDIVKPRRPMVKEVCSALHVFLQDNVGRSHNNPVRCFPTARDICWESEF